MAKQDNKRRVVRFEVLAPGTIFWDVTPLSLVAVHRRFGVPHCLTLQGLMVNRLRLNGYLLGLLLCSVDGGDTFLRNVGTLMPVYRALCPRK
jgi:hypothetical protein